MKSGYIENMVRNDLDHIKKSKDKEIYKWKLRFILLLFKNDMKYNVFSNSLTFFFFISNLMSTPRFWHKVSLNITFR